jgi:hypothetical protein
MTDLSQLTPSAVSIPPPELHEALVHDDATEPGELIRCMVPSFDPLAASDPMPWMPHVTAAGVFYPKRGDRAVLAYQVDGTPVILAWWPDAAAEPDSPF